MKYLSILLIAFIVSCGGGDRKETLPEYKESVKIIGNIYPSDSTDSYSKAQAIQETLDRLPDIKAGEMVTVEATIINDGTIDLENMIITTYIETLTHGHIPYLVCRKCYPVKNSSEAGHCLVITIYNSESEMRSRPCENVILNPETDGHWIQWFKEVMVDRCADGIEENLDCSRPFASIQNIPFATSFGPIRPIKINSQEKVGYGSQVTDIPTTDAVAQFTVYNEKGDLLRQNEYLFNIIP